MYTTAGSYEAAFNSALVPVASAASGVIKPPNEDPPKETTLMVSSFATLFVEPGFLCSNKVIGLNESSVLLLLPGSGLLGPTQLPLIGLWVVGLVVGHFLASEAVLGTHFGTRLAQEWPRLVQGGHKDLQSIAGRRYGWNQF